MGEFSGSDGQFTRGQRSEIAKAVDEHRRFQDGMIALADRLLAIENDHPDHDATVERWRDACNHERQACRALLTCRPKSMEDVRHRCAYLGALALNEYSQLEETDWVLLLQSMS